MKAKFYFILRVAISLAALFFLLWWMKGKIKIVLAVLATTRLELFSIAFLITAFCTLMNSFRLRVLLTVQNIHLSPLEALRLNLAGIFFNNFLPTSVGGDLVKAHYASKKSSGYLEPVSAIIMDRLIGALTLTLVAVVAFIFLEKSIVNMAVKGVILAMFLGTGGIIFILLNQRTGNKIGSYIKRLSDALANYKKNKNVLGQAILFSLLAQAMGIIANYFLARSLALFIPLKIFFLLMPVIGVLTILPSLNGLGIREGAYVYFFGEVVGPEKALAISLLWLAILLGFSIIGGITYALRRPLND